MLKIGGLKKNQDLQDFRSSGIEILDGDRLPEVGVSRHFHFLRSFAPSGDYLLHGRKISSFHPGDLRNPDATKRD